MQEDLTKEKTDNRYVIIQLPDGSEVKRIDYIQELFKSGVSRSEITKKLSDIAGEKIPYQIVYAATKDIKSESQENGNIQETKSFSRGVKT